MKIALFSTKSYDKEFFDQALTALSANHEITYFEPKLNPSTVRLAEGFQAICVFVNDSVDAEVLKTLAQTGVKSIALRCAGFNQIDLETAGQLGIKVVRVPTYSPYAVAEHTVGLILTLNRQIHRAYSRVREGNFSLEGLMGFDLHGKTVGLIGTGTIGSVVARILNGFGCRLLGFDPNPSPEAETWNLTHVPLEQLLSESNIISLHCPLTPDTHYLINDQSIGSMMPGTMLINTSRGAVIDTKAAIRGLKSGQLGALGLDVYEEEGDYFFEDLSAKAIADDTLARLLTFPNVLITGHQAFFTREAMRAIAETTLNNLTDLEAGKPCANEVSASSTRTT